MLPAAIQYLWCLSFIKVLRLVSTREVQALTLIAKIKTSRSWHPLYFHAQYRQCRHLALTGLTWTQIIQLQRALRR